MADKKIQVELDETRAKMLLKMGDEEASAQAEVIEGLEEKLQEAKEKLKSITEQNTVLRVALNGSVNNYEKFAWRPEAKNYFELHTIENADSEMVTKWLAAKHNVKDE